MNPKNQNGAAEAMQCSGPFSDARDCPVHAPRLRPEGQSGAAITATEAHEQGKPVLGAAGPAFGTQPSLLKFFRYEHLPPNLREISKPFALLAHDMVKRTPAGAEQTTMLRKLLEAKDCAVRAVVEPTL